MTRKRKNYGILWPVVPFIAPMLYSAAALLGVIFVGIPLIGSWFNAQSAPAASSSIPVWAIIVVGLIVLMLMSRPRYRG